MTCTRKPEPLSEDECYDAWLDAQTRLLRSSPCWRCMTGTRVRLRRADIYEHEPTPRQIAGYLKRLPEKKKEHDPDLDNREAPD